MTTKTFDSTISQLLQDNSSVEYVDAQENPLTTIPNDVSVQDVEDPKSLELIFGQKHNEIDCALCPTAKRACNRAWFSAKQVENWSEMPTKTLWRWLERIEKARRISRLSDMTNVNVGTSTGAVKTKSNAVTTSKPLEKSRGFLFVVSMVLFRDHLFPMCYKPFLSRGHEVKRPKDLKNFFLKKKLNEPLDTMTNVIYVTRNTTERYAVFVSSSACNPSFGQGYAHQPFRRKSHDEQHRYNNRRQPRQQP